MPNNMIKAIVFDFGQTLVDSADGFRAAEKQVQGRLWEAVSRSNEKQREAGNSNDNAAAAASDYETFLKLYRHLRKELQSQSNYSRKALFLQVLEQCGYTNNNNDDDNNSNNNNNNNASIEHLCQAWQDEYWETVRNHTTLLPEALEVLRELKQTYQLALLTNTQGQQQAQQQQQSSSSTSSSSQQQQHRLDLFPSLQDLFSVVCVAGESNGDIPPKPDKLAFLSCLQQLDNNVQPTEAVYVGDDYRNDVCGSAAAGMHPIWCKHATVKRSWPVIQDDVTMSAVPVITNLRQLLQLDALLCE